MTERIRMTVSLTPEVHALFHRLASISGVSLGRCIGDWLDSTSEGAEFIALKLEQVKVLPKTLLADIDFASRAINKWAVADVQKALAAEKAGERSEHGGAAGRLYPPPSNTGGKGTHTKTGKQP